MPDCCGTPRSCRATCAPTWSIATGIRQGLREAAARRAIAAVAGHRSGWSRELATAAGGPDLADRRPRRSSITEPSRSSPRATAIGPRPRAGKPRTDGHDQRRNCIWWPLVSRKTWWSSWSPATGVRPDRRRWPRRLEPTAEDRAAGRARFEVTVDGWVIVVTAESADARPSGSERRGWHRSGQAGPQTVKAKIPGRVARVWVAVGAEVQQGDRLLSIEAMKMENEIRAPRAGTVIVRIRTGGRPRGAGQRPRRRRLMMTSRHAAVTRTGGPHDRSRQTRARDRWREGDPGEGHARPVGAPRDLPDHLRHPHPRPVHPGRHRGSRRGPGPGTAGEFPFTRGVQPTMYRGRLWTMRQYAGFSTAADTNERFRYLLSQGQTGLSVAFDLPTQMGYDSDASEALGEVGRVGVPISSLEDMENLLDGLPLGEVTSSMTINATAAILLAFYVAVADRRGIPRGTLGGTVQNDILKEYIARGTYIYPTGPIDAPGDGHLRVLRCRAAALEHHQHQRLSHARGGRDRGAGAGFHPRRRHSVRGCRARARARRGRLRGPVVVFLRGLERAVRGGGQIPGRPSHVGADHARPLRGARRAR